MSCIEVLQLAGMHVDERDIGVAVGCAVPTALNGGAAETRSVAVSGDAPSIRGAPSSVDAA